MAGNGSVSRRVLFISWIFLLSFIHLGSARKRGNGRVTTVPLTIANLPRRTIIAVKKNILGQPQPAELNVSFSKNLVPGPKELNVVCPSPGRSLPQDGVVVICQVNGQGGTIKYMAAVKQIPVTDVGVRMVYLVAKGDTNPTADQWNQMLDNAQANSRVPKEAIGGLPQLSFVHFETGVFPTAACFNTARLAKSPATTLCPVAANAA